ncbi:MAG: TVP38/TMEM64 family protein [Pirellulales bacterium]|nr:TVP38/TMEM64 family protein [Pirellulales bacterium]
MSSRSSTSLAPVQRGWRMAGVVVLVAAIGYVLTHFAQAQQWIAAFFDAVAELGPWGVVLMAGIYIPACILFLPGSLLTLGAGAAFGVGWGTVAVSIGSTLGATCAFLTGRTLARRWVEGRVAGSPRFQAIDEAVARQGFKIVLLTRLSPVFPFNVLNYALGLTRVRLRDYVLASWIGMLPGTLMYVYLGSAARSFAELLQGHRPRSTAEYLLFVLGLIVTVLLTVVVTRIARKALAQDMPPAATPDRG